VGEEFVDEGPGNGRCGFAILGMKRPRVVKPVEGGGGRSLVGLDEREVPTWPLVITEVGLLRKRRTPFILPAAAVGSGYFSHAV
jgi:hypothetical protein